MARQLSVIHVPVSPLRSSTAGAGEAKFDFLSAVRSPDPGRLEADEIVRAAGGGDLFSHDLEAAQDAATIAVNAARILREAGERLEAARAEEQLARKKERKVRIIMADSDPLVKACKKGDDEKVRELLALQDPDDVKDYVNSRDKNGSTPIFHTVWPGHLEALRILLDNGADPNIQNNRMNTALHLACEREHGDLIIALIQYGASITLLNANGQKCYDTLADPLARNKMENFTKRCFNDVRRGNAGDARYRLPKLARKQEFWSREYYAKDYFTSKKMPADLPERIQTQELRKAIETPKSDANAAGVPNVDPYFLGFLETNLKDQRTSPRRRGAPMTTERDDVRPISATEPQQQQQRKKLKRQATTFVRPADPDASSNAAARSQRRRKSTGDISSSSSASSDSPAVRAALRSLQLYADLTFTQAAFIQFILLMHPHRLPPIKPLPAHAVPQWLHEYMATKAAEQRAHEEEQRRAREAARPRRKDSHEFVLTRLRTSALASATSPHFNASMLAAPTSTGAAVSSAATIPHAHQPDMVRPVVALLKDLTVHLPVSHIRPVPSTASSKRSLGTSASTPSLHTRAASRSPTRSPGAPDSWDATSLALDREQASNVLKHPSYGNWVLRQLSVLNEVEEAQASERTRAAREDARVLIDDAAMHITDPELTGLIDHEVEKFIQTRYPSATPSPTRNDPLALTASPSKRDFLNERRGSESTVPLKLKSRGAYLANLAPRPAAPSPRLNALAAEFLADEKQAHLRGLYHQVSSVLTRLKKSSTLYIAPSLARKLKQLNPSLLAALDTRSHATTTAAPALNTGGLRTEYATLGFSASANGVAQNFETQVRQLIEKRKYEREEAIRTGRTTNEAQAPQIATSSPTAASFSTPPRQLPQPVRIPTTSAPLTPGLTPAKSPNLLKLTHRSPGGASLQHSASTSQLPSARAALSSAAMQRALIQQYNPRTVAAFIGGGSVERTSIAPPVFQLNVTAAAETSSSLSPSQPDPSAPTDDSVQVMEIHHSPNYATYRAMMGTSPSLTSSSRLETSFARHPLEMPAHIAPNPLVAPTTAGSPARLRTPSTPIRSPSAGRLSALPSSPQTPNGSATTAPLTYAELNPTRRPNLLGHANAATRPKTPTTPGSRPTTASKKPVMHMSASTGSLLQSPARLASASAQRQQSPASHTSSAASLHSPSRPTTGASYNVGFTPTSEDGTALPGGVTLRPQPSAVVPIFDVAPKPSLSRVASSISARISTINVFEDAGPTGAESTTGLLKRIKHQQDQAKPLFKSGGRVTAESVAHLTSSGPSRRSTAEKRTPSRPTTAPMDQPQTAGTPLSPHLNAFTVGIPIAPLDPHAGEEAKEQLSFVVQQVHGKAMSFARDTTEVAMSLGAISGSRVTMAPKIGYAAAARSSLPPHKQRVVSSPTLHTEDADGISEWFVHPSVMSATEKAMSPKHGIAKSDKLKKVRPAQSKGTTSSRPTTSDGSTQQQSQLQSTNNALNAEAPNQQVDAPSDHSVAPPSAVSNNTLSAATPASALDPDWSTHPGVDTASLDIDRFIAPTPTSIAPTTAASVVRARSATRTPTRRDRHSRPVSAVSQNRLDVPTPPTMASTAATASGLISRDSRRGGSLDGFLDAVLAQLDAASAAAATAASATSTVVSQSSTFQPPPAEHLAPRLLDERHTFASYERRQAPLQLVGAQPR